MLTYVRNAGVDICHSRYLLFHCMFLIHSFSKLFVEESLFNVDVNDDDTALMVLIKLRAAPNLDPFRHVSCSAYRLP